MTNPNPTRGQLERTVGQRLQALYRDRTGHRPEKVTCQFFDEKLTIVLEQIVTPLEQFFLESDRKEFAQQIRSELESSLRTEIIQLIEETTETNVSCLLSETNLKCNCSGLIAVLEGAPSVRDPASIPKIRRERVPEQPE
jgi:uncharacterized protein YbcI